MAYRLMATYRGIGYAAGVGPTDADVVLFASAPPAGELGFEPDGRQWRKRVSRSDLDALWEHRPVGRYRSHPCLVLDEIGDRLHITHLGHDAYQAERLGYWQVDRGVYEVVVPRDEVTDLTEERIEHPVRRGGYESWDGTRVPDRAPSPNGSAARERSVSANGLTTAGPAGDATVPSESSVQHGPLDAPERPGPAGTDAGTGEESGEHRPGAGAQGPDASAHRHDPTVTDAPAEPSVRDELPGTAWTDMMDRLPPPRPLPKRRRAGPRASRPHDPPDPSATASAASLTHAAPVPPEASGPMSTAAPPPVPSAAGTEASPEGQGGSPGGQAPREQGGRRRRARVETRWIFRDLVDMAAIPHRSYAVDEEVDGALCLIRTDDGYEVFSAIDGTKHEVRFFEDEESAYFYLFGVLAAEAVRGGRLVPSPAEPAGTAGR